MNHSRGYRDNVCILFRMLLVIILHFQPFILKCRARTLLHHSLIVNILDPRAHIFGARNGRFIGILILFGDETKAVEERGRHGLHQRVDSRSTKVEQAEARHVQLVCRRGHDAVYSRLYKPCGE